MKHISPLYIEMSSKVKITIETDNLEKNKVAIKNKIKDQKQLY